jgi:peroxiredoxin
MWHCEDPRRGVSRRRLTNARRLTLWGSAVALATIALASPHIPQVGDDPPDVLGKSSTGEAIHLKDYRGRIVVISFFASWCGPCRKEVPMLMKLQEHATRDKVVVFSVNWRQSYDEFRQIGKIFEKEKSAITLVSDERGHIGDAYSVKGIPHMLIVGRDGKIVAIHVGYSEDEIPVIVDEINGAWAKGLTEDSTSTQTQN